MELKDRLEEIGSKFDAGEITGFLGKTRKKYKLFRSSTGSLCYFKNSSTRKGFLVGDTELADFDSYISIDLEAGDKATYKLIAKYRKLASLSEYTTDWIDKCLALPDSYEAWQKEGKKGLYESGITTGNKIDGVVITMGAIKKAYPRLYEDFMHHYNNDLNFNSGRYDFRGYEMSLSIQVFEDGSVQGYLSMEYKGCGNGYYYLMINSDTFIGYDVD